MVTELEGDLIEAAKKGEVGVIAHGCNCYCVQKKGFALEMAKNFQTDRFPLEDKSYCGDYNKLGQIDYKLISISKEHTVWVVNMYGQYHWSVPSQYGIPLDYDALKLCFRKLNYEFKGYNIGLPGLIGSGLAKGKPALIKELIASELINTDVFIYYPKNQ